MFVSLFSDGQVHDQAVRYATGRRLNIRLAPAVFAQASQRTSKEGHLCGLVARVKAG